METVERDQQMTAEEVLENYYAMSSTETVPAWNRSRSTSAISGTGRAA